VAKSVEHWVAGLLVRGGRFCGRYGILGQLHQVSQRGSFCFLVKRVDKVIEKEEQHIQRLQIDAISERKQSLVTDMVAKQEKVTELQQGRVIPLNALFVVRLWHRKPDQLAARCATLKNAFIAMGGQWFTTQLLLRTRVNFSIKPGPGGPLAPIGASICRAKIPTWQI
jgi:hypothetical protein